MKPLVRIMQPRQPWSRGQSPQVTPHPPTHTCSIYYLDLLTSQGPSQPLWRQSLLVFLPLWACPPAPGCSVSLGSALCPRPDRLTWAFPTTSELLGIPRHWVCQPHMFSSSFSFLLMKEAIAQIIWKGRSGIYYLGVPLLCCSHKFKLRFLRIRLNMTKTAEWAVSLSTCRLIEPL